MTSRWCASLLMMALVSALTAEAQFRRGILAEGREITFFPLDPPALLLPAGSVEVSVRNTSTAPVRIVERLHDLLRRQLIDNDSRLRAVETGGDFVVVATLTEWSEGRRSSTKYVSERRQVGIKQVTDKEGKVKTEPVYEYGYSKPSVVISGAAGMRVEVRRAGGAVMADETARHTINEEHLSESGPPSRNAVENTLADNVIRKAAGRISPGREPVRVLLARSDDVDNLNLLAQNKRWQDWLGALEGVAPHRDRKRDSYRLHNLALAHEALAYEASATDDSLAQLAQAATLVAQASQQNPDEKYIVESSNRIKRNTSGYQQLAGLYRQAQAERPADQGGAGSKAAPATAATAAAAPATRSAAPPLSNKDVLDLRTAGLDDDNLIAAIKDAKAVNFDLSPAGLTGLLAGHVSNAVIAAMRRRSQ